MNTDRPVAKLLIDNNCRILGVEQFRPLPSGDTDVYAKPLTRGYLVFGGACFYAQGGGYDFLHYDVCQKAAEDIASRMVGKYAVVPGEDPDEPEAKRGYDLQWTHVFSLDELKVVSTFGDLPLGFSEPAIEFKESLWGNPWTK